MLYDFIIYYHQGILNPANGLLWRPDYFTNQVEDSAVDKLMPSLINKLVIKNTVTLRTNMWYREDIFLNAEMIILSLNTEIIVLSLKI